MLITVDTEEDNWVPTRYGATTENIRQLPAFQALCERLGARPTYFTAYQVLEQEWSVDIMRGLKEGGKAEVAGHLHPWNTPPFTETVNGRNTMLHNLPAELQGAKLRRLTDRFVEIFDESPTSFRAGRFGLGANTLPSLIDCGFRVDSSVTPFWSWEEYDDGPDFHGAPIRAYRLDGLGDPRVASADGRLVEIPVSGGFDKTPFDLWARVHALADSRFLRRLRAPGIASRLGVVRKIMLSPETEDLKDLLALSRCLIDQGASHLNLILHSSTLHPGLSPFTRTSADVERVLSVLEGYIEGLANITPVRFRTVGEAASELFPDIA